MYLEHFGIDQFPFLLTPNVQFFCNLPGHQAGLNVLLFSLSSGEGFIKIVGEVGSGKTLLCRKLLSTLGDEYVTAYIPNPDLNSSGLRRAFAKELGLEVPENIDQGTLLELITEKLIEIKKTGRRTILVVDEAQALPEKSLEALRLLTNLETESEKLLQIVLFGQPELDQRLGQYRFRQLKQRITFSHALQPIAKKDLEAYLCHRLSISGYTKGSVFDRRSTDLLFKASEGIPRVINILCHKSMLVAFGRGEKVVTGKAVKRAIQDSQDIVKKPVFRLKTTLLLALVILLLLSALGFVYFQYLRYLYHF